MAKQRLNTNFQTYWRRRIDDRNHEKKLGLYATIKDKFQIDPYLSIPSFDDRKVFAKFICSNHSLEIEKGRHTGIPREERICKVCDLGKMEDEQHFLLECPGYTEIRHLTMKPAPPNGFISMKHIFSYLSPHSIARYLKSAFKCREQILNYRVSKISICDMRMTLCKGTNTTNLPAKSDKASRLQVTDIRDNGLRFKISRK